MKKIFVTLGSIVLLAFVVVMFANASSGKQDDKKAKAEVKKEASCDPAKCKADGKCDPAACPNHKEGTKCDPAKCTAHKDCAKKCAASEGATVSEEACDPAKCTSTCTKTCSSKK